MRKLVVWGTCVSLWIGVAGAQALIEHALAATGGSAAGVAGKKVSDSVDKIFGKLNQQAGKVAGTGNPAATSPVTSPVTSPSGFAPESERTPARARRTRTMAAIYPQPPPIPDPPAAAAPAPAPAPPAPPALSAAEVAAIPAGTTREDLFAKLGRPASRITIPEEGQLRETFHYLAGRELLGTVRLVNGAVVSVEPQRD